MTVKLWLAPLALAVLVAIAGCSDDDAAGASGSLTIRAQSGDDVEVLGVIWFEPCHADGSDFVTSRIQLGQTGTVVDTYYSNSGCTSQVGSETISLTISDDGSKSVDWQDESPGIVGGPNGLSDPATATRFTIGFSVGGQSGETTGVAFVDDRTDGEWVLYLGFADDDDMLSVTGGYPDYLFDSEIPQE